MTTYLIAGNEIKAFASPPESADGLAISSLKELGASRLKVTELTDLTVAAGGTPLRGKQRTRDACLRALWTALKKLPLQDAAPSAKKAPPDRKPEKGAQPSKAKAVIGMLSGSTGTTIADLVAATGWQAHSVRGFLSGTVRKRMGHELVSEKGADGERRYRIA